MASAWWIATVKITDSERYRRYQQLAPAALKQYGARLVLRSDDNTVMETRDNRVMERCVIFEFDSMEQAKHCYYSKEYAAAREARKDAALVDITLVPCS